MIYFLFLSEKQNLTFHAHCPHNLHEMSNPVFCENKKNISKCRLLKILLRVLSVITDHINAVVAISRFYTHRYYSDNLGFYECCYFHR